MASTLLTFDTARLQRFEVFCDRFRAVFPRADQYCRFRAYLFGLLAGGGRKNVETIAAHASTFLPDEADLSQALQHFVSRSPWDAARLRASYREFLGEALIDPESVWVVHDAAFPKKGRHSVGVHRQFARSLGRKVNCQIAVVVGQVGPTGYFPLTGRLYLPAFWLHDLPEHVERTVPEAFRNPSSKADIGLSLIDELLAEGRRPGSGVIVTTGEIDRLGERNLLPSNAPDRLAEATTGFDSLQSVLGLRHYEGRTWAGWHHHLSLVFVAFAFLAAERTDYVGR